MSSHRVDILLYKYIHVRFLQMIVIVRLKYYGSEKYI